MTIIFQNYNRTTTSVVVHFIQISPIPARTIAPKFKNIYKKLIRGLKTKKKLMKCLDSNKLIIYYI